MKPKTKKQRLLNVIIALLMLFVAFVAVRFFGLSVPCPSHTLFGVNCMGCGATRMVVALTKGDIYQDQEKLLKTQNEYNFNKEKLDKLMEEWMELSE